ncbi:MAG: hypothetical protein IPK24_21505 [Kineosporiaceae bacterium]|nr:hypothetical protein [Kineosporiaceae bacterium]
MGLTMVQRRAVLASQVAAWPKAARAEVGHPDRLVAVNGWHRDHARKMIRAAVADGGSDRAVGQRRAARAPVCPRRRGDHGVGDVLGGAGRPDR